MTHRGPFQPLLFCDSVGERDPSFGGAMLGAPMAKGGVLSAPRGLASAHHLAASSPFLGVKTPFLGVKNPFLGVKPPFLGVKNPFLGVKNPFLGQTTPKEFPRAPSSLAAPLSVSKPSSSLCFQGLGLLFLPPDKPF